MTPQEKLAAIGQTTEGSWLLSMVRPGDKSIELCGDTNFYHGATVASIPRDDCDHAEAEANARLIALAPALRRFAERVLAEHEAKDDYPESRGCYCFKCQVAWPCPTVQAAQEELGGEP